MTICNVIIIIISIRKKQVISSTLQIYVYWEPSGMVDPEFWQDTNAALKSTGSTLKPTV